MLNITIRRLKRYVDAQIRVQWYQRPSWIVLLRPLAWCYRLVAWCHGQWRRRHQARHQGKRALWVVGNITVGGNHKTPCVAALVHFCHRHRIRVGVVMRGYGAQQDQPCYEVRAHDSALWVGDEALWLKQHVGVPVMIAKKRRYGIAQLCQKHPDLQVIVCDDGLQDQSLLPDLSLALYADPQPPVNTALLPEGPFREPITALQKADWVLVHPNNHWLNHENSVSMLFEPQGFLHQSKHYPSHHFQGQRMHAFAAIAHPERFFETLVDLGVDVIAHSFPDHHPWQGDEFASLEGQAILVTSKDAVKLSVFEDLIVYVLEMRLHLDERLEKALWLHLNQIT